MSNEQFRDICGNVLTAIAATYYVYTIIDVVTDGRLSYETMRRIYLYRDKIRKVYDREKRFVAERNHVQFEAWEVINGESEDGQDA